MARALDEARGWSRWTVGGVDRHAIRVARKIFAQLCMALSGRYWPAIFTGTETLSGRTVDVHARDGAAGMALVVDLQPGARWLLRTAPIIVAVHGCTDHTERDAHPIPLGEKEAVGLSASGLLPRPKCATTGHRGKWRPGRERSMSCRCGHGPWHHHVHPHPPPQDYCPALHPYVPPLEPRPPRRRCGGNQGLSAAAPGRVCQASAGRGRAEAPAQRAGAATTDRGGGAPRRSERTTTAATNP